MPRFRERFAAALAAWRAGTHAGSATPKRPAKGKRPGKRTKPKRLDRNQRLTITCALCSVIVLGLSAGATYKSHRNEQEQTRRDQTMKNFLIASSQLSQADSGGPGAVGLRVGAVRSLGELMQQSPEYRSVIVDRLSSFIRDHATARPRKDASGAWIESPPDIVAAVKVLAARPEGPHDARFTIEDARLSLPSEHLERARLAGADLDGAILAKARLGRADLSGARFTYANLRRADLQHTRLRGADLAHAHLTGADLSGADLRGADLATAVLSSEDLRCAQADGSTKLPPGVARPAPDPVGCP